MLSHHDGISAGRFKCAFHALLLLLNRGLGICRTSSSLRDYIPSGTEQTEHNQNQKRNAWHRGLLTRLVTLDLQIKHGPDAMQADFETPQEAAYCAPHLLGRIL